MTKQLRNLLFAGLAVVLAVACSKPSTSIGGEPIVLGYSNWAGWWPWAIAVEEKLFEKNGVNVEMKWFDGYVQSMETFAAGKIDGNSQTLNDTISFLPGENGGEVVVLVNDNSAGNDQIIADKVIETITDLKGKTVAVEEGVVDDFLLSLALRDVGLSRDDVIIKGMPTDQAATAFAAGKVDAVGAFPPYTGTAMQRDGEWTFRRGLEIYDQGGMVWLETEEQPPEKVGIKMRNVRWPYGNNRPSLVLYAYRPDEDRAVSYAWADPSAQRIGINLRWMQASCTLASR